MKKIFRKFPIMVIASLSIVALAATVISKDEVNKKVAAVLTPFNNPTTAIELLFTDLNVDALQTLDFGVRARAWKIGPENEITLNLTRGDYHFGDGTNPQVDLALTAKVDLVKLAGQKEINEMAKELDKMALEMAADYTKKYGAAITFESQVDNLTVDQNGDVESLKMHFTGQLDFANLPANLPASEVEFKSFKAEIMIGRTGAALSGSVILNPQHRSFANGEVGLKETIEKLLSDDQETYQSIGQLAGFLDSVMGSIVERKGP